MGERIKAIRKHFGLTQQEFADRLQISRSNIATYEADRSNIGEAVIKLICREYGVNETWLRTGEGEMLVQRTRDNEIADFMSSLFVEDNSFRRALISVMARTTKEEWEMFERKARELLDELDKADK